MLGDVSVRVCWGRAVRGNSGGTKSSGMNVVRERLTDEVGLGVVVEGGRLLGCVEAEKERVTVDELIEADVGSEAVLREGIAIVVGDLNRTARDLRVSGIHGSKTRGQSKKGRRRKGEARGAGAYRIWSTKAVGGRQASVGGVAGRRVGI